MVALTGVQENDGFMAAEGGSGHARGTTYTDVGVLRVNSGRTAMVSEILEAAEVTRMRSGWRDCRRRSTGYDCVACPYVARSIDRAGSAGRENKTPNTHGILYARLRSRGKLCRLDGQLLLLRESCHFVAPQSKPFVLNCSVDARMSRKAVLI